MNIKYTHYWLMSGTESVIEISDHFARKGVRNVLLFETWPEKQPFELPNDDRLDSLINNIKGLESGEINRPTISTQSYQALDISGVGYFKWYGKDLPNEWQALQTLVRYLRIITKNIRTKPSPMT